jgi:hypothetical protein
MCSIGDLFLRAFSTVRVGQGFPGGGPPGRGGLAGCPPVVASCDQPIRLGTGRGTRAFSLCIALGWREVGSLENGDPILELGV